MEIEVSERILPRIPDDCWLLITNKQLGTWLDASDTFDQHE